MSDKFADLAHIWRWFGETQFPNYSPIYERIALGVAKEKDVLELVLEAPPAAHLPTNLLAAVHYELLAGFQHPLADVYAGRSDADPVPLFLDVCRVRRAELGSLLATRRIQTNECGRSALIGPGLTWLATRFGKAIALVDVGTSAGLNLLCDLYRLDYGSHGASGPIDSPVQISCRVDGGNPPIAWQLPQVVARVGIDRSPIDLADGADARWLLACVWPDTGRLERTAAAINLARGHRLEVVLGDANAVLPAVLAGVPPEALVVVVTTWVFAYFAAEERRRFSGLLAAASLERPVAWLSAEGRGTVAELTELAVASDHGGADVLGVVTFEGGHSRSDLLGYVHSHGLWMDWRAGED
ncbi:MAG: DUF2332 domain-containing protein [Acidimicrobiales bacterium]